MSRKLIGIFGLCVFILAGLGGAAYFFLSGAPESEADSFWNQSAENNIDSIDHSDWQYLLEEYLIADDPSGVNLVDYQGLIEDDKDLLDAYISQLSGVDPRNYNRAEQQAYWINLYNALTVQIIIENYPTESITKLGKSSLSFGPWDDQVVTLAGRPLSLNDIEHRILRPLWNDYRIHFAVNCASIGCPNLQTSAFTAENSEALLTLGAEDYLAHSRGVRFDGSKLVLSSIFDWYGVDFGDNQQEVLITLSRYAPEDIAGKLSSYDGSISFEYNWQLNEF